jgi:hypothetical protein
LARAGHWLRLMAIRAGDGEGPTGTNAPAKAPREKSGQTYRGPNSARTLPLRAYGCPPIVSRGKHLKISGPSVLPSVWTHSARSHLVELTSSSQPRRIQVLQLWARVRLLAGCEHGGEGQAGGICPHRRVSGPGGAPILSNLLQQAPIDPAGVAGHPLLDAARGLDLSRRGGARERTLRIVSAIGTFESA